MVVLLRASLSGSSSTVVPCYNQSILYTNYIQTFTADCSDLIFKGKCQASIVVYETGRYVLVQFKGETGVANFASNIASIMSSQTLQSFESYGKVGQDSLTAFNRIWYDAGMNAVINDTWNKYCDFSLFVSGHGLGGCQAQMAGLKIVELWNPNSVQTSTFGSPRCGNADFAAMVEKNVVFQERYLWFNDPVGQYPSANPSLCDYSKTPADNVGKDCWFHTRQVYHMKTFKLFGTLYTFDTCTLGENKTCLTGNTPADHYGYVNTVAANYDNLVCTTSPWSYVVIPT